MGPAAGQYNWSEQISKMRSRVQKIQIAKASIQLNTHTYNARIVPVTSYVAQLLPCPKSMDQVERALMHTALRLPQNTLCHADFFHLQDFGGPKFRSIVAASASALLRTSLKTVTTWREWIGQLDRAAQEWLCLLYTSPSPRDGLLSRMPSSA